MMMMRNPYSGEGERERERVRPRLLDLFCGAGGASAGYRRAGFDVVGVDIAPQPRYPFAFVQADALEVDLAGFDAIHASPPCQAWTAYRRRPEHVASRPDLVGAIRRRLEHAGVPYVIENVRGAPLRDPLTLCGSMFGLEVRRHRLFESNALLLGRPCAHPTEPRYPGATNRAPRSRATVEIGVWRIPLEVQRAAMEIPWMSLRELSEAIPPAYTEWVGRQLL